MNISDLIQILNAAKNNKHLNLEFGSIEINQIDEVYIPPVLVLSTYRNGFSITITINLKGQFKAVWVNYRDGGAQWDTEYTEAAELIRSLNDYNQIF